MEIEFQNIGQFSVIGNPTSLQFGPDGRLYVSAQSGEIIAYTVDLVDGQVTVTDEEELFIGSTNLGLVQSISNYNDDGSLFDGYSDDTPNVGENAFTDRQVTGLLVTGTASNPVLYISSSDPRIATFSDTNLDTNSGVVTRATLNNQGEWEVVDIVRGLPRSEENHSVNGMQIDTATNTLYLQVGGNTNNGAPSTFFANTPEYALSGTLLEIDLDAIEALEAQGTTTDPNGGRIAANGANNGSNSLTYVSREVVYDLPTLDNPNYDNAPDTLTDAQAIAQGFLEDSDGLDLSTPFGGNDGFNQAILDPNSPVRIFSDGGRNNYDVILRSDGLLFSVDNGGNGGLGDNPNVVNGEVVNTINNGGDGDDEPLQQLTEGGNLGHPNPTRANQDGIGVIFNDAGEVNQDPGTFSQEQLDLIAEFNLATIDPTDADAIADTVPNALVSDISALVPSSLNIPNGFVIDPSRFAAGPGQNLDDLSQQDLDDRLELSGTRVDRTAGNGGGFNVISGEDANNDVDGVLAFLDNSTNGITEFVVGPNASAGEAALNGALIASGQDGLISFYNVNDTGTALDPFIVDGEVVDEDGILTTQLSGAQLDVTVGLPGTVFDGVIFTSGFGPNNISALVVSDAPVPGDPDIDDDGLFDLNDPFSRDPSNGALASLSGGETLVLDFDANQDGNLVGPDGFGGGLTGLAINGQDNPEFLLFGDPDDPNDNGQFGNLRLATAALGGTTNIVDVPSGTSAGSANDAPLLLQSAFRVDQTVETFTVRWVVGNPGLDLPAASDGNTNSFVSGANQEIGGFIGIGDQSNILRIVATHAGGASGNSGAGFIIEFEDDDVILSSEFIAAADLFTGISETDLLFETITAELLVDRLTGTATPTISYVTAAGATQTVNGSAINISGTNLEAALNNQILLDAEVGADEISGVALGLFATNGDASEAEAFSALFDEITVETTGPDRTVIHRVNAGGPEVAALDGGVPFTADTNGNPSPFRVTDNDSSNSIDNNGVTPGGTVPASTPAGIFDVGRFDTNNSNNSPGNLIYSFPNLADGLYDVVLFLGNGFSGAGGIGDRIFDVEVEGNVPTEFDNLDPVALFTNNTGGAVSTIVEVTDGTLDIEFIHVEENPNPFGLEIALIGAADDPQQSASVANVTVNEADGVVNIEFTSLLPVPSDEELTVTFNVTGGTAQGEVDFDIPGSTFNNDTTSFNGLTATITDGNSVQFPIDIIDDLDFETPEEFTVEITSVLSNNPLTEIDFDASAPGSTAAVTILSNDADAAPTGDVLFRVNAGGPEVAATDGGIAFGEDQVTGNGGGTADTGTPSPFLTGSSNNAFGSSAAVNVDQVTDFAAPEALFQVERFNDGTPVMQYGFPVDAGTAVDVTLFFNEGFVDIPDDDASGDATGDRVFDILIDGALVADDFDIFAAAGNAFNSGIASTFQVVSDGSVDIEFNAVVQNPSLRGIEIRLDDDAPASDTTPPSATASVGLPSAADGDVVVTLTLSEAMGSIDPALISLDVPITEGGTVTRSDGVVDFTPGTLTATVTFAAPIQGFANGDYTLSLAPGALTDVTGNLSLDAPNAATAALALTLDADEIFDENVDGDLSDDNLAPTDLPELVIGSNIVTLAAIDSDESTPGTTNPLADRDYFTIVVPEGAVLNELQLVAFESTDDGTGNPGFLAIADGDNVNFSVDEIDQGVPPAGNNLLGGVLIAAEDQGTDILGDLGNASLTGSGFSGPLQAGTYTLWLNQNAGVAQASLDFVVVPAADAPPVIDPATPSAVTVDENVAEVLDGIDATDPNGDDITFSLAGTDADNFTIDATTGALSFATAPDFEAATDFNLDNIYEIDLVATANGVSDTQSLAVTVADVDQVPGEVVVAVNAGGGQVTFNGIEFASNAGTDGGIGEFFSDGGAFADNGGGGGGQNGVEQSVNEPFFTERNGGGGASVDGVSPAFLATLDVSDSTADLFTVDLYFAELFFDMANERVFDVTIEGELVLDNLDIRAEVNALPDAINLIKTFSDIDPTVTGSPDAIEILFDASGPGETNSPSVTGIVVTEQLDEFVAPTSPVLTLGVADPATLDEGDDASSVFVFPVTFSEPPAASITVTYDLNINGIVTPLTQAVPVEGGAITVTVPDDDIADGDELITVTITGFDGDDQGVVLGTSVAQTAQVTEDDVVPTAEVTISPAPGVLEGGDDGSDLLSFQLNSAGFDGTTDVTFTVDGGAEQTASVTFVAGVATLPVSVAQDDLADGDDVVSVTITGVSEPSLTLSTDPAALTATGTTTEDDADPAITGGPTEIALPENTEGVIATYTAEDLDAVADGETLSFALSQAGLDAGFSIDATTGELSAPAGGIDFEGGVTEFVFDVIVTSDDAGEIATATQSVTVTVTDVVETEQTTRIQAEQFDELTGFFTENQNAADAGQVIRLPGNSTGTATVVLSSTDGVNPGPNDITVAYFDESDGTSEIEVLVNNVLVGTILLNQNGGGNAAQGENFRTVTIPNVTIAEGDVLALEGASNAGEFVRIDYVELTSNAAPPLNFGPSAIPTFEPDGEIDLSAGETLDLNQVFFDPDEDALTFGVTDTNGAPISFLSIVGDALVVAGDAPAGDIDIILSATDVGGSNTEATRLMTLSVPEPPSGDPVRIQAEDFDAFSGFFTENQGAADEGQVIRLTGNATGTASASLTISDDGITPGVNDITVAYFDESDGVSTITVQLNGVDIGTIILNQDGGGNAAQAANFRTATIQNVTISDGDELTLVGDSNAGEFVRIDYVEFTPEGAAPPNLPPALVPSFEPDGVIDLVAGQELDLNLAFTDPDEDTLTFTVEGEAGAPAPAFLSISGNLLVVAPTAPAGDVDVVLTATDASGSNVTVSRSVSLSVEAAAAPPALAAPIDDVVAPEDAVFTLDISANFSTTSDVADGPGDADITFTAELLGGDPLPAWLSFDAATGVFSGTPLQSDIGVLEVAVTASDDDGGTLQVFSITVENSNDAPFALDAPTLPATVDTALDGLFDVATLFDDEDLALVGSTEVLTFAVLPANPTDPVAPTTGLPAGVTFNPTTGAFGGTPTEAGTFTVAVEATDVAGETAQTIVTFDVAGVTAPSNVLLRINAGGAEIAAIDNGPNWLADVPINGAGGSGDPATSSPFLVPIANAAQNRGDAGEFAPAAPEFADSVPDAVLDTARSATLPQFGYAIPLTAFGGAIGDTVTVNLYFAETANVTRNFDAAVEGIVPAVFNDITPGTAAGSFVLSTTVTLTDDVLDLGFIQDISENPIINGIEIVAADAQPLPPLLVQEITDATATEDAPFTLDVSGNFAPTNDNASAAGGDDIVFSATLEDGSALPAWLSFDPALATFGGTPPQGEAGAFNVTVTATDDDGAVSDTFTITVQDDDAPATGVLLRINTGGPAITSIDAGPDWSADVPFAASGDLATSSPFLNPITPNTQNRGDAGDYAPAAAEFADSVPDSVLDTARSSNGEFGYSIPISQLGDGLAVGDVVTVNLYFAETSPGSMRSFDATIEGVLPAGFDEIQPATAPGSFVLSQAVTLNDDTLNLDFLIGAVNNPIINGIEIVAGGEDPIDPPPPAVDPTDALEVLGVDDGVFDGNVQGEAVDSVNNGGGNGSVLLTVADGNNNVQFSNFGDDSFQITNTGNKEIAAVFIDIRGSVFGDHVFDNDGTGGDIQSQSFQIDGDEGTGAFFVGADGVPGDNDDNLFFQGPTPLPDTSGLQVGGSISGGSRGLLIRFDGSDGGFGAGETVGFSGDGDPNSIAGFSSGDLNPNAVTAGNFDTGGQSGAELIGSSFTALFADGTTATGFLGSDTTQAGAVGEAVQGRAQRSPELLVDTGSGSFASNGDSTGTYGGDQPVITVSGQPGDMVRVTLFKGFNPTDFPDGSPDSVTEVIQGRLDAAFPEFPVNNIFDVQTFDVQIEGSGTATLPAGAFNYSSTNSGITFPNDDVQPIALTAHVLEDAASPGDIDGGDDQVPLGALSTPVYLLNPTQTPVDDSVTPPSSNTGHFEIVDNEYFKIQIEDANGVGAGTNPVGDWTFLSAPDANGNQPNFQGDGYYLYGSESSTAIDNTIVASEVLEYTILIPEGETGTYSFEFRVSRDDENEDIEGDQQNDIWLNFKHAEEDGFGEIEEFFISPNEAEPTNNGFIKLFGGPQSGNWGETDNVDGLQPGGADGNFDADIEITEAGLYTIQIAGRSQGFHLDYFELFKFGEDPGNGSDDSPFIITGGTQPTVVDPIDNTTAGLNSSFSVAGTFQDLDGDTLTLTTSALPTGVTFNPNNATFSIGGGADLEDTFITVTATDDDGNSVSSSFVLTVVDELPTSPVSVVLTAGSADDHEFTGSLGSGDLESDVGFVVRFTLPGDISNLTSVTSAVLSGENEDGGAVVPTGTITIEDTLSGAGAVNAVGATVGSVALDVSGPTAAGTRFDLADIADAINDLIASQGPLNGGDVLNVVVNPTTGRRDVQQGTLELDLQGVSGDPVDPPSNTPPVVVDDTAIVQADGSIEISPLDNDSDPDGDTLSISAIATPADNGEVLINPDGVTLTYIPDTGFAGSDSFNIVVSDGNGGTSVSTVNVTVTTGEVPPVASDDTASTQLETPIVIDVLDNDTDANGDTLSVLSVTNGQNGSVVINGNGTVTYTPNAGFSGTDTFTYDVSDGNGGVDTGDVTVTVSDGQSSPVDVVLTAGATDDQEFGGALGSGDLESNVGFVVRFTVPDDISELSNVTSAVLTGENEDGGGVAPTGTITIEDTLSGAGAVNAVGATVGSVALDVSGPTAAGTRFELADIADAVNALIASQGPLNGGDVINVVVNPTGGRRDVQQGTLELELQGDSGGSGGGTNPPVDPPEPGGEITLLSETFSSGTDLSASANVASSDLVGFNGAALAAGPGDDGMLVFEGIDFSDVTDASLTLTAFLDDIAGAGVENNDILEISLQEIDGDFFQLDIFDGGPGLQMQSPGSGFDITTVATTLTYDIPEEVEVAQLIIDTGFSAPNERLFLDNIQVDAFELI